MKKESSVTNDYVVVFIKKEHFSFPPFVGSRSQSSAGFKIQRDEKNEMKRSPYRGLAAITKSPHQ